jgi:predicted nucleic acid-binding Zn ribbon protein
MKSLEDYNRELPYRKNTEQTLGTVLLKMLEAYGLKDKMQEVRIKNYWMEQMGPSIASYTKSVFVKNHKVVIRLQSASLRQELSYAKEKIKKMFNDLLGEEYVEEVVLM